MRVHAEFQYFYGHLTSNGLRLLCTVDDSEATFPNSVSQCVVSNPLTSHVFFQRPVGEKFRFSKKGGFVIVEGKQFGHASVQCSIILKPRLKIVIPSV